MMKKTFVALAVLGACGMAAAQSSVTVYGTADAGIGRVTTLAPISSGAAASSAQNPYGVIGLEAPATLQNGCLAWDTDTRLISSGGLGGASSVGISSKKMNNGPSILGLKGLEDIGGGNYVGFQFETGLSLEDGSVLTDDAYAPWGGFWGRHANVFMTGGWGTLKLGRQPTVTHLTEGAYELTGLANYSVVRNTFGVSGFVSRANSVISYTTPNMGGLQAAVAFASKNNFPYNHPTPDYDGRPHNMWDAGVTYSSGALAVGASVNNGLDDGKKNYHVGAKFRFGDRFALAASYHNGTSDGGMLRTDRMFQGAAVERIRRGYSLGAQARFGALTVTLDVTRDTRNEWTGGWSWDSSAGVWAWAPRKYTNALLEGKYSLSKRTFLYGAFLRLDGSNNWGLGLNHSF